MKRAGFTLEAVEKNGNSFHSDCSHSIESLLKEAARTGKINTMGEEFVLHIKPFESKEDPTCDSCGLVDMLCNCNMILPDPHPHIVLLNPVGKSSPTH